MEIDLNTRIGLVVFMKKLLPYSRISLKDVAIGSLYRDLVNKNTYVYTGNGKWMLLSGSKEFQG